MHACADDRQPWGYVTKEAGHEHVNKMPYESVKTGPVLTTSVEELMSHHSLEKLEFVKIDIEGAEGAVFSAKENLGWLRKAPLLAIKFYNQGSYFELVKRTTNEGLVGFTHGEYTFFASPHIATTLNIPH